MPIDSIVVLSRFLQSPPGRYVLAWEQQHLDAAVVDMFGYHAMQLGLPELDALRENRILLRFCASDRLLDATRYHDTSGTGHTQVAVINRYEELPFASQSIDLVVMPHILEFAEEPHQVLREVDRVLVPEGHVVITGFNPASLWGLRQVMTRVGASPFLPRAGQFLSLPRIKDWLKLLSFEVNRGRFGCYVPSVRSDIWLDRWRWIEKAGDRWWPFLGSVYMVTAVKRVRGMRLVGALKRRVPAHAVALTPASTRIAARSGEAFSATIEGDAAANDGAPTAARALAH